MNTTSFLTALRAHPGLELVFRAGGQLIAPGYHLTEAKRVTYETVDCGRENHRWTETQFEIWAPAGAHPARGHMPAAKFLTIVERVEQTLPLDGEAPARIHTAFAGQPASLFDVVSVTAAEGRLWVELNPDRTRCKAAERSLAAAAVGCCQPGEKQGAPSSSAACGCGSPAGAPTATACCT